MVARVIGLTLLLAASAQAQSQTPPTWKWHLDRPGSVTASDKDVSDTSFLFTSMAPGWHITMGPGGILYDPRYFVERNWSLEAEIFLFPGESNEGYGVFFGGTPGGYYTFVLRRDGSAAIMQVIGTTAQLLRAWTRSSAIVPASASDAVKQVLRVNVDGANLRFFANGTEVFVVPRTELGVDGSVGFRVGKGLNLHAARLDLTQRLAPVRGN
jgi:hypothetical protein